MPQGLQDGTEEPRASRRPHDTRHKSTGAKKALRWSAYALGIPGCKTRRPNVRAWKKHRRELPA